MRSRYSTRQWARVARCWSNKPARRGRSQAMSAQTLHDHPKRQGGGALVECGTPRCGGVLASSIPLASLVATQVHAGSIQPTSATRSLNETKFETTRLVGSPVNSDLPGHLVGAAGVEPATSRL
jgi:hypothetical protein